MLHPHRSATCILYVTLCCLIPLIKQKCSPSVTGDIKSKVCTGTMEKWKNAYNSAYIHTHTHAHTTVLLFFWNMSGTTQVSRYQKGKTRKVKTNLDLLEQELVSGSGICWAICKSAPQPDNHANIPPLHLDRKFKFYLSPASHYCVFLPLFQLPGNHYGKCQIVVYKPIIFPNNLQVYINSQQKINTTDYIHWTYTTINGNKCAAGKMISSPWWWC